MTELLLILIQPSWETKTTVAVLLVTLIAGEELQSMPVFSEMKMSPAPWELRLKVTLLLVVMRPLTAGLLGSEAIMTTESLPADSSVYSWLF